jgi:periplasmic protein TonB
MGYQALLFCPDEKTGRTVTQVLSELDFTVVPCTEPFAAVKKLMAQHFDAVVVDCDNEQNATLLFKSARNSAANQASLAVAVVEGQAGVAKAFRIGANLVLTKPINVEQAKGTLRVARGLLRKGTEAAKATVPANAAAVAPAAPAKPAAAAPKPAAATSKAPTTLPETRKPAVTAVPVKTSAAPAMPAIAASTQVAELDDLDADTILEADIDETPAPQPVSETRPAMSASAGPAAGTAKFPWQPSPKMAEPMASALRRAAEAVGQVEVAEPLVSQAPAPPVMKPAAPAPEKRPMTGAMFQAQASAAAAAPATIKVPTPPVIEDKPELKPAPAEKVETPKTAPSPLVVDTTRDVAPPTFFPGGYDTEENEGGGKTKALIIVAAVVLLACSAGYLSWRNMGSSKTTVTPANTAAPASSPAKPAASQPALAPEASSAAQPVATDITLSGVSGSTPAAHANTGKTSPKTPEVQVDSEPEPEVTQKLIVKQENGRIPQPAAPQVADAEAPSAIGIGTTADGNSLDSIGSTTASLPKAAPQTVKVSQGVMEGLVIKRVQPRYPTQALQMRIQGAVQMQATITKEGDIQNLKVISGDPVLGRAAQEAVKQWKYKPYFLNGEPVAIETQILVNFKLPN